MIRRYLFTICAGAVMATASTNISNNTSYTQTSAVNIVFREDISGYFSANGITASTAVPAFPDNGIIQTYGLNPGNCHQVMTPYGVVCTNYRFICQATVAADQTNSHTTLGLIDLNALYLNKPDDPPGTCYLTPFEQGGTSLLELVAYVNWYTPAGSYDRFGTMGWFAAISGGAAALTSGNYINIAISYNPRTGDPTSFTWGNNSTILQNVFTLVDVSNVDESTAVAATSGGVFAQ